MSRAQPRYQYRVNDGRLYLLFGLIILTIVWVASAEAWQPVGNMTAPRSGATATLLSDGTVLVAGGEGWEKGLSVSRSSTERFDPQTNTFSALCPMHQARLWHVAARLRDGRVLVAGGAVDVQTSLASAELFDPSVGRFSRVGDMAVPREAATATALPDGRLLVVGGLDATGCRLRTHPTAELFDPFTRRFQATGSLTVPRFQHAAVALPDGRVVVLGGHDDRGHAVSRVEIYDPASGTFTPQGDIVEARAAFTATLLPTGKILLAGGYYGITPQQDRRTRASVEVYDPATGRAKLTGIFQSPRFGHEAVPLADGRILLVGGWSGADPWQPLRSAEGVNPAAWHNGPSELMTRERAGAASVLLPDGRVLILGGIARRPEGGLLVLATAEAYEP